MPIGNPIQKNNDTRVISATATTGQTDFTVTGGYTINAIGVFRNGVRLNNSTDFTAADGSTVTLNVAADAGDTVTFHIFDKFTVANAIVGAASTQTVYGNLAVNGELYSTNFNPTNLDVAGIGTIAKAIIGTGVTIDQSNIDTVGLISATTFTGNLTGDVTGAATQVTLADESSDTTCFPLFATGATGNLAPKTGTNLTFNSATGELTASSFAGPTNGSTGSFSSTLTVGGNLSIADKIIHTDDGNTAIRFPSADTVTVETAGSERLRITSAGKLLTGGATSAQGNTNADDVQVGANNQTNQTGITLGSASGSSIRFADAASDSAGMIYYSHNDNDLSFFTSSTRRITATSTGRVGVGTSAPGTVAHLLASDCYLTMQASSASGNGGILFKDSGGTQNSVILYDFDNDYLKITTNADTEALRIDSSQRLLIGHTASEATYYTGRIQVQGVNSTQSCIMVKSNQNDSGGPALVLAKSRGSLGGTTVVQDSDQLGSIYFNGADGTDSNSYGAEIRASVDGSPGSNDMPGRLAFFTTADGAATSTERLRIDSKGMIGIGGVTPKTQNTFDAIEFGKTGFLGSQTGARTVEMASNAYYNSGWKYKEADVASQYYQYQGYHAFTTATSGSADGAISFTERLRISVDGVIGANTSSTITDLHTSYRAVQNHNYGVWSTDDGGASFLSNNAYINSSGNWVRIANDHASDFGMDDGNFYFRHIGAGTGTITWRMPLQIEQDGKSSFTRVVSGTSGDHPCLKIDTTSSGTENSSFATGIDFLQATVHKKRLAITKGNAGTGGGDWIFYEDEGNTRQLELFDGGDVEVSDGDLIIGTAAHGIDFSAQTPSSATGASASNEVLNHYEAGSWAPTIEAGGWALDSNPYSRYVRVGNLVHVQFYIGLSGTGNSDALKIGGLPFAVEGNGYSVGTVDFGQGGIKGAYMRTVSGANTLTFLYPSENTSNARLNLAGNQVGSSYVIATISYYVP